jgi:glycosyltransferase involved in cell wall biosynthesis
MSDPLLSILIPLYNEEEYIQAVLDRVVAASLPKPAGSGGRELIVVDDGSTDGSREAVEQYISTHPGANIRLVRHERNRGKGAAVRTALGYATGQYSIIQDADLEYDPCEYTKILEPLLDGDADVVYGSRFMASGRRRVLYFWHALANWTLTTLCNVAADLNLTDMGTCYKAFRTSLAQTIPLRSDRFGIEAELTIKFAKRRARIYETPITYRGRTYEEGKKVRARDGWFALGSILRFWLSSDIYTEHGPDILDALSSANHFNRWMADTVAPYLGAEVLEIGAGMGNLTRHLAHRRKRYIATDIDLEHLSRLAAQLDHRPNVSTAVCNLTEAQAFDPFRREMDSVVCLNVVEHTDDDGAALRNLFSCLKAGGRAVVLVPQGMGVYGTLDEALGHFRRYSRSELKSKMEAAGFRVEQIIDFNRVTYPGWALNGRVFKRRNFSRLQLWAFDRLVWLWRRIDRMLPWPPASIIAIGVRDA